MYRLLIVDDERLIADGLFEALQNARDLDLDIYKAYSAKDALAMLKTARIDIAMTDIRMPGMDGLKLLEIIKSVWPQCRILILTGYSQFDYIYKAVQYSGVSYLLKSEGYDKIIRRVRDIIDELDNSVRVADILSRALDEIKFNPALIQKDYLSSILTRPPAPDDISQGQFDEYGIPLDASRPVLLLLGRAGGAMEDKNYSEKMKLLYGIRLVSQEYFAGQVRQVQIPFEKDDLIWFIQPNACGAAEWAPEIWRDVSVFVSGVLETIQAVCKGTMGVPISFALNAEPVAWPRAPAAYHRLRASMERWSNRPEGFIFTFTEGDAPEPGPEGADGKIPWGELQIRVSQIEILERYLDTRQQEKFNALFQEITDLLLKVKNRRDGGAIQLYSALALMFLSYINRNGLADEIASRVAIDGLTHYDGFLTWRENVRYLTRLSYAIFELAGRVEEYRYRNVIIRLEDYIRNNIDGDLSLVRLSEFAHFNPSYLSRLFKQLTGVNLSEYINEERLRKAKELLATDMRIHEVAKAVGYESSKNFTRFFKKQTNMTPQEYKDLAN